MDQRWRVILHKRFWTKPTVIISILFVLIAVIIAIVGQLSMYTQPDARSFFGDFYTNISTDLISIAVTVLIIDSLNQRRADNERKKKYIRDLRNPNNGIALSALNELRAEGWVKDGSLRNAYLKDANLDNAYLRDVDLSGAWMRDANLSHAYMRDAKLTDAALIGVDLTGARELTPSQLSQTAALLGAILPDGSRYDGRFNLHRDIKLSMERGYDLNKPEEAARFYGIPLSRYLESNQADSTSRLAMSTGIFNKEDWLAAYLNPDLSGQDVPNSLNQTQSSAPHLVAPKNGFPFIPLIAIFILAGSYFGWLRRRFRQ